jgi:hypothetical protein
MCANLELPHGLFNMIKWLMLTNMYVNLKMPHGLFNKINMIKFDLYMYDHISYYQLYYQLFTYFYVLNPTLM